MLLHNADMLRLTSLFLKIFFKLKLYQLLKINELSLNTFLFELAWELFDKLFETLFEFEVYF